MALLLNFPWIKLPRNTLPPGKGIMGSWASLAARVAFRPGQADYCGHRNDVELASWVGGIVGLKSILGINNRQKAMAVMDKLSALGYISYRLRSQAFNILSLRLWAAPAEELDSWLEVLTLLEMIK